MSDALGNFASISFWVTTVTTVLVVVVLGVVTRLPAIILAVLAVQIAVILEVMAGSGSSIVDLTVVGFVAAAAANVAQGFGSLVTGEHDPTRSTIVDGLDFQHLSRPAHTLGGILSAVLLGMAAGAAVALWVATSAVDRWLALFLHNLRQRIYRISGPRHCRWSAAAHFHSVIARGGRRSGRLQAVHAPSDRCSDEQ